MRIWCTTAMWKWEFFCSAPGQPDDPWQVLCWLSISVSSVQGWVKIAPPPLPALDRIFNPFLRHNPQTPKHYHMDLWSALLVLTHLHLHLHLHQLYPFLLKLQTLELREASFFNCDAFSLAGYLLPFMLQKRAAFQLSFSLVNMSWK